MASTTPRIQTTQTGPGAAEGDRDDLLLGVSITIADLEAANSGASYQWFLDNIPVDSSMVLTGAATATPSIAGGTIDEYGSARLRCVVDGVFQATATLGFKFTNLGGRYPYFQEEPGQHSLDPDDESYHKEIYASLKAIESSPIVFGKHLTGESITPGVVKQLTHGLVDIDGNPRAYKGWFCTNGIKCREMSSQPSPTTRVDVMVETMELVERKVVSGGAVQEIDFSLEIDSSAAIHYFVRGAWYHTTAGNISLVMRPGGGGSPLTAATSRSGALNGAGSDGAHAGDHLLSYHNTTIGSDGAQTFACEFAVTPGENFVTAGVMGAVDSALNEFGSVFGGGDNAPSNFTTIRFTTDTGTNQLDDDTWIEVWRLVPGKTTGDFWVF